MGGGTFPIVVSGPIRGRDPGLWLPASTLGNVVHSPKTLGVAYEDPPRCEDKSLNESMNANCCQCVGGTAGGISAPGAQSWGDVALVGDDGRRKKRSKSPTRDSHRASHLRHARAITRSRWSPSSLEGTPRALDEARTTTLLPSGRSQTRLVPCCNILPSVESDIRGIEWMETFAGLSGTHNTAFRRHRSCTFPVRQRDH